MAMKRTDEAADRQGLPRSLTYEEFLARVDEDVRAEWVNGEVVLMSPVSDRHADLSGWLEALLRHYCEARQDGWVRSGSFQMKTGPDLPGREPDVLVVLGDHVSRVRKNHLDGPADIAVEIVSPESAGRDRGDKFYEYERGGVREYWLIDPMRCQAEFYQQSAGGLYVAAVLGEDGVFRSNVLDGFWIEVRWLWQEKLPMLMSVLKAWDLA